MEKHIFIEFLIKGVQQINFSFFFVGLVLDAGGRFLTVGLLMPC